MTMEKVTVLADESLGGVLREYCEVTRKANVGQRIKIVNAMFSFGDYENGEDMVVRAVKTNGVHTTTDADGWGGGIFIAHDEYVVLEPTDVVVINGERFRMVDRKAAEGDYFVFFDGGADVARGKPYTVAYRYGDLTFIDDGGDIRWPDHIGRHAVLVTVEEAKAVETVSEDPADYSKLIDGLTETVAKLALRVTELECRVGALVGFGEDISAAVEKLRADKPITLTRDEIVEKAKLDVAKIIDDLYGERDRAAFFNYGTPGHMTVRFEVNRDKRTVEALVGWRYVPGVRDRGIAKCSPDDCFNVYIGRAIALRRALGLEIPEEYVKAPQPTEPRVGDVVTGAYSSSDNYYSTDKRFTLTDKNGKSFKYAERPSDWIYICQIGLVVDDSREGISNATTGEEVAAA